MKNLTTPTAALIGVLAFGACAGSAFASTSTVDTLATAAAPAGAPAIAIGDPAASSTPVAGKVATFAGQTVPAGGVAINGSQIAYDGGATILTLPTTGFTTQAASDCASGYLCLWQAENYGGRRLQFSSTGCHAMGDYGFNDAMTSWYNRLNRFARLRKDSGCNGDYITANSGARSSNVGGGWNDEVSSVGIS